MTAVGDLRAKLAQTRAGTASAAGEIAVKREELRRLRREIAAAKRLGAEGAQRAAALEAKAAALADEIEGKQKQLGGLKSGLADQLHQLAALSDPTKQIESLSAKIPILLFPIRIETRFRRDVVADGKTTPQLWIRIYPDDCQIDGFEPILTESEVADATAFWAATWRAGGFEAQERGAWRAFAGGAGSGRAAYVISQFTPNPAAKPTKAKAEDVILVIVPRIALSATEQAAAFAYWTAVWQADGDPTKIDPAFGTLRLTVGDAQAGAILEQFAPDAVGWDPPKPFTRAQVAVSIALLELPPAPPTKSSSWTQAPKAAALPDRFVALLYNGGVEVKRAVGLPVHEGLAVAPDPSLPAGDQLKVTNDDLELNDDLRWIADFERAVAVGMGLKIDLTPAQAQNGFERLIVVGLRVSSDEMASKKLLEELIAHQHASKAGYSLVPQGSPTNNTESGGAAYTWADDPDSAYDGLFKGADAYAESDDPLERRDGQWLAEALGIDGALLKRIPNANHTDQAEARAMNVALWNGTAGYMLEEMMTPLFSRGDIAATRLFFTRNVLGRGPLPAIRVGRQPYGILPALAFSRYRSAAPHAEPRVTRPDYLQRLHGLLARLDADWRTMSGNAAHVGQGGDPHQTLLDIVGLHSGSVEYHQRYAKSFDELYNKLVLEAGPFFGALLAAMIAQYSRQVLTGLGADPNADPPILGKFFYGASHLLSGPLVDDKPLSESDRIRPYSADGKNYVEWLAASSHDAIRRQDFGGKPAPHALLYLMLRHSMMLAHWDAGLRLLEVRGIVDPAVVRLEPAFIHVQTAPQAVQSKFERLYQTAPSITGNDTTMLAEHILLPAVLFGAAETEDLREVVAALKVLAHAPTARLERAFAEHVDCCSYRLDAWKTALATARLREMRVQTGAQGPRPGIHLGAFGWLENLKPKIETLQPVRLEGELAKTFQRPGEAPLKHDAKNEGYIHAPSLNHAAAAAILKNAYANSATPANPDAMAVNLSSDRVRQALAILEGIRNGQTLSALLGYRFERGLHDVHDLAEVDKFIYPLRQAFPLVADKLKSTRTDGTVEIDLIEARNVIDGVALVERLRQPATKTYPFGLTIGTDPGNAPPADSAEAAAINREADRLLNLHDAVGDLVMAESIYQVVLGNFDRAAANTQAFSEGHHPPETQIVNTPRSGLSLTHRVTLHLDPAADPTASPSAVPMTPRAAAEAPLNLWLAGRMPPPADVAVRVTYTAPVLAGPKTVTLSQADLGLQPLDVLYLFNLDLEQAMTELDDRIVQALRYGADGHPDLAATVDYTVPVTGKVSFFELAALVRSLRAVLLKSRALGPTDMTLPLESASSEEVWDDSELAARVTAATAGLALHRDALVTLTSDASDLDTYAQMASGRLLQVALHGIPQTGIGQIHGDIRAIYDAIVAKVRKVADRWQHNANGYAALLAAWPTLATDEERFALLRKAEALVSATLTPVPDPDPTVHRAVVDAKKALFDNHLAQFQALLSFGGGKLVDFAAAAAAMVPIAAQHDVEPFDVADQQAAIANLRAVVVQRVTALADDLSRRVTAATGAVTAAAKLGTSKSRVAALLAAAKSVLGDETVLVPRFRLPGDRATEFKSAFDGSAALLADLKANGRRLPVDDWFYGVARVRGKLNALENAIVLSEAFGAAPVELTPMQLPFLADDRWAALEFDTAKAGGKERLLYTGHFAVAFDPSAEQCALLLDEWPELVPATDVMSGVTFQFDRPSSEPPQIMLLALPSAPAETWHWDDLVATLNETLDNARSRAVEPSDVDRSPYAHFLPATLMAVTLHQITIATNIAINNAIYDKIGSS